MIHDFDASDLPAPTCDFGIIGAGTVGLPMAVALAKRMPVQVVCLESGGMTQRDETHPLNRVIQTGLQYEGAEHGRFRCLGGTSTRWGGALIPFQESDVANAGWPIPYGEIAQYLPVVEDFFGLDHAPYTSDRFPAKLTPEFVVRYAKWPAFKRRNVYNILRGECHSLERLTISTNATVTAIRILPSNAVELSIRSPSGRRSTLVCKRLIIAAGAIESTRLALMLDRDNEHLVSRSTSALGRFFADHLSIPIAEVAPANRSRFNEVFGYGLFRTGAMTNLRFEAADKGVLRSSLPPFFCHVSFETIAPGAFDALKVIYRNLQSNKLPPAGALMRLPASVPWLVRAAWWRFVKGRLLYPADARIMIHAVVEQAPLPENRITLHDTECDAHGVPVPVISWRISERDVEVHREIARRFVQLWGTSDLQKYGTISQLPDAEIEANLSSVGGIYHPTGSTRMAADAAGGVVNRDLALFHCPAVQIVSTSVLPTGGGSNPTMMALLLAMRCVEQHIRAGRP